MQRDGDDLRQRLLHGCDSWLQGQLGARACSCACRDAVRCVQPGAGSRGSGGQGEAETKQELASMEFMATGREHKLASTAERVRAERQRETDEKLTAGCWCRRTGSRANGGSRERMETTTVCARPEVVDDEEEDDDLGRL